MAQALKGRLLEDREEAPFPFTRHSSCFFFEVLCLISRDLHVYQVYHVLTALWCVLTPARTITLREVLHFFLFLGFLARKISAPNALLTPIQSLPAPYRRSGTVFDGSRLAHAYKWIFLTFVVYSQDRDRLFRVLILPSWNEPSDAG